MLRFILGAALAVGLSIPSVALAEDGADYAPQRHPTSTSSSTATATKKKVRRKKKRRKKKKQQRRRRRASSPRTPVVNNLLAKGSGGIRLGFNVSSLEFKGDIDPDFGSRVGLQAGAGYDKAINDFLSYRFELNWASKGTEIAGDDRGIGDADINLGYLEVPIILVLRFEVSPGITPYVGVGGYGGFLLSHERLVDGKPARKDENGKLYEDRYANIDYGMNLSLGAWFVVSKGMMASAEFRYVHGFADIIDHDETGIPEDETTHNRSYIFSAGVNF